MTEWRSRANSLTTRGVVSLITRYGVLISLSADVTSGTHVAVQCVDIVIVIVSSSTGSGCTHCRGGAVLANTAGSALHNVSQACRGAVGSLRAGVLGRRSRAKGAVVAGGARLKFTRAGL